MSDEQCNYIGIRIPLAFVRPLIAPLVTALLAALLGGNLWNEAKKTEVRRAAAAWDTEIATRILDELKDIKERLPKR